MARIGGHSGLIEKVCSLCEKSNIGQVIQLLVNSGAFPPSVSWAGCVIPWRRHFWRGGAVSGAAAALSRARMSRPARFWAGVLCAFLPGWVVYPRCQHRKTSAAAARTCAARPLRRVTRPLGPLRPRPCPLRPNLRPAERRGNAASARHLDQAVKCAQLREGEILLPAPSASLYDCFIV